MRDEGEVSCSMKQQKPLMWSELIINYKSDKLTTVICFLSKFMIVQFVL